MPEFGDGRSMRWAKAIRSALGALLWLAGCLPVAGLPLQQIRELSVLVLVDEEFRRDPNWKSAVENALDSASSSLERTFGLRFNASDFRDWKSSDALSSVEMLAEDLAAKIDKGPVDKVVAFSGQKNLDTRHGGCSLCKEGVIVLRRAKRTSEMARALKHETGHLFAAVHVEDSESLMDIFSRRDKFDPRNEELVLLNRDRSFQGTRFPLPKKSWERTAAIWREISRRNALAERRRMADAQETLRLLGDEKTQPTRRRDLDDVHLLLSQVLIEQEKYQEALGECQAALRITQERIEALNFSGIALRRSGRMDRSEERRVGKE